MAARILLSDLAFRPFLRNLRILAGMRDARTSFKVFITGVGAPDVAGALKRLEPAVDFEIGGGGMRADFEPLAAHAGGKLDAVVVTQPYHSMRSSADTTHLIRDALNDEDGTLGFIWHRATATSGWVHEFGAAAMAAQAARSDLLPPLGKLTALEWVDAHLSSPGVDARAFKPLKHRKFLEKAEGRAGDLLPLLRAMHDARLPPEGPSPAFDAGAAAVAKLPEAAPSAEAPLTLSVDLHAWHTSVVPRPPKLSTKK